MVPDPDRVLAESFAVAPAEVATQLGSLVTHPARASTGANGWRRMDDRAATAITAALDQGEVLTEPGVACEVLRVLSDGATLVVSSSMPVRDLECYAAPRTGVRVIANRGANGIDGVVSTAIGVALAQPRLAACLVGDLAFLHDVGALLGLRARDANLLLVVVDNDGGGIFSFLPQAAALGSERFEQLFGTPHGLDLVAIGRAYGIDTDRVEAPGDLRQRIDRWATRGGPRILVVPSTRGHNVDVHRALDDAVGAALGL
jgi:2-succinyl-5-enolpyruvyl-6-hydroxy-3-cyclohexene-1-carboxylate synthase